MKLQSSVIAYLLLICFTSASPQVSGGNGSQNGGVVFGGQHQKNITVYKTTAPPRPTLKNRVNALASELEEFAFTSEGSVVDLQSQAMAITTFAAMKKANVMPNQFGRMWFFGDSIMGPLAKQMEKLQGMDPASIPSPEEMRLRIEHAKSQTQRKFLDYYWPKISEVTEELADRHIETSGISRGVAHGNLRAIAFALSVAADGIGNKQDDGRVFTSLEGHSIFRGDYSEVSFEVGALSTDRNSLRIAERIHESLVRSKAKVSTEIHSLSVQGKNLQGIHLVLPSPDLQFNFGEMIRGFNATELQYATDVRVVSQPPTIIKIEVWPQTRQNISAGPDLFNLQH